ncbi:MAG: KpsF/GutQ family sugar-phosphate isomerase [Rickettsiales bacterium]|nr:MAG: KpsF/GutQ family sugar-phosphate isomerase [Rickettsiales bacterium]
MAKYKEYAKHSLNIEIKGLQSILSNSLDSTFDKVIDTILETKGRVILSALGKPGYIARKIAATLSSTGTQSFYIHPSEASHGDLGMIAPNDILILLSSSGESKELRDLISYSQINNLPLIGVTRKADSFLANEATIPVVLPDIGETNFLNSPTTSSLMFLAYFDAVMTTLIKVKDFKLEKYKTYHPGGKLGINMLSVDDLMYKGDDLPLCSIDTSMKELVEIMVNYNKGSIIVSNKKKDLLGFITDGDFKRIILKYTNFLDLHIEDVMIKNPVTIKNDVLATEALKVMQGKNPKKRYFQNLIVTNNKNKVVGLLHIQELFNAGVL